jgi:SAM-dependent methyltransferase
VHFHESPNTIKRVADRPESSSHRARHWHSVYLDKDPTTVSWFQEEPTLSLALLDALGAVPTTAIIDVGGGESRLVDRLLARDFSDVTVLDISATALAVSEERVGKQRSVAWIAQDLLLWQPKRRYDLWHDRAVFHFLAGVEIDNYRKLLDRALAPEGAVVLATVAPDGPEYCSGLPVIRYDPDELASVLGAEFEVLAQRRELHHTPNGTVQPFSWIAARRRR